MTAQLMPMLLNTLNKWLARLPDMEHDKVKPVTHLFSVLLKIS